MHCLPDTDDPECPLCSLQFKKLFDHRRSLFDSASQHDQFYKQVKISRLCLRLCVRCACASARVLVSVVAGRFCALSTTTAARIRRRGILHHWRILWPQRIRSCAVGGDTRGHGAREASQRRAAASGSCCAGFRSQTGDRISPIVRSVEQQLCIVL